MDGLTTASRLPPTAYRLPPTTYRLALSGHDLVDKRHDLRAQRIVRLRKHVVELLHRLGDPTLNQVGAAQLIVSGDRIGMHRQRLHESAQLHDGRVEHSLAKELR